MGILQRLGGQVRVPRYPLLHEQPFYPGRADRGDRALSRGRTPAGLRGLTLPQTECENQRLIKLPTFCHPAEELLEQYRAAFECAVGEM